MKKNLIILFISLAFLSSCAKEEELQTKKYFDTANVSSWSLLDSDSYIWYTDSFNNVSLSPKLWWKIVSIKKDEWDNVKVWELLISLDGSEAKSWYSSTLDIIDSLENLKKSTSEMFDKQVSDLSYKIDQANIWVDASFTWKEDIKNITDNRLKTVESNIEQVKNQIKNTNEVFSTKKETIYNNSKNSITNANILWNNLVDFLDTLYWVTDKNKYKNDSFEIYLWAKDSSLKTKWENELRKVISDFEELKKIELITNKDIKIALEKYHSLFSNEIRILLKDTNNTLENSVSSSSFPQTTINELKTQTTTLQNQTEQVILTVSGNFMLWLKGSLDNILALEKEYTMQIEWLEKQLETLNQTYLQYKAMWEWQINEVESKSLVSQKQLEEIKASIETLKKQKETQLKQIDTQISQAKAGKNEASVMIENSKVYSPISWVITKKLAEIWQVTWWWIPILVISDDSEIKIELLISDDINIEVWQEVKAEIEWISEIKTWVISKILPDRDVITKKIKVEIKIDNSKKDIKLWSFSKVYFDIKNEDIWMIIPNSAIISKFMIPWVYVLKDSKAQFKNIEILKQNDNFSEILWLNFWDEIITNWKENIYDWETLINN